MFFRIHYGHYVALIHWREGVFALLGGKDDRIARLQELGATYRATYRV